MCALACSCAESFDHGVDLLARIDFGDAEKARVCKLRIEAGKRQAGRLAVVRRLNHKFVEARSGEENSMLRVLLNLRDCVIGLQHVVLTDFPKPFWTDGGQINR